jgi:hypothetical protein
MTPERAKELAEANGCEFKELTEGAGMVSVCRRFADRVVYKYMWPTKAVEAMSEADFIASLPDKRD